MKNQKYVLVALLALGGCGRHTLEQTDTKAAVAVSVETAVVGTVEGTVSATGLVTPAPGADWVITAPEAARIAELPKSEGESVAVGDLLLRFDIPSLPAELAAKRAAVTQAKAQIAQASAAVVRIGPLVTKGISAQKDLEDAKRAVADAEAALAQAESGVTAATALEARTVVRARFAGVVAKRWHNAGDFVEASASDPVLRIIDPHALLITASVPVAELPRIEAGHTGFVIGPSGEGEPVRVLSKPPQIDPTTTMAEVRLVFAKPTKLTAGTAVQILIVAETHAATVVIPAAAVVHDDDETFVMVVDKDNKAHRHDVVLGLTGPDKVEVLSGIKAGDVVVFRGQGELPDGGIVTIVK
jgi:cobalt-zinc-cadmium efflux system membrane fusion protein